MWRKIAVLLMAGLLTLATAHVVFDYTRSPVDCRAWWFGVVNDEMVNKAREDFRRFDANGCRIVAIEINSPGGYVVQGFELVRMLRELRSKGVIVETHGGTVVASAATMVFAAGSPGHRYIYDRAFVLVHGVSGNGTCESIVPVPTNLGERVTNQLIIEVAKTYSDLSGHPIKETLRWLECGREQLGTGSLLLKLSLADHVVSYK